MIEYNTSIDSAVNRERFLQGKLVQISLNDKSFGGNGRSACGYSKSDKTLSVNRRHAKMTRTSVEAAMLHFGRLQIAKHTGSFNSASGVQ